MNDTLQRIPVIGKMIPAITPQDMLLLYDRKGRLRATLRMQTDRWWHGQREPEEWWWYPSPDGRAIVYNIAGNGQSECLLFRW
jgi:hypothetical protein